MKLNRVYGAELIIHMAIKWMSIDFDFLKVSEEESGEDSDMEVNEQAEEDSDDEDPRPEEEPVRDYIPSVAYDALHVHFSCLQ